MTNYILSRFAIYAFLVCWGALWFSIGGWLSVSFTVLGIALGCLIAWTAFRRSQYE